MRNPVHREVADRQAMVIQEVVRAPEVADRLVLAEVDLQA
jgi:hypothetical protein